MPADEDRHGQEEGHRQGQGHARQTVTRKVKQTQPATLEMPTAFTGQNGAEIHQTTPVSVTGCVKAKAKRASKKHKKVKRGKK